MKLLHNTVSKELNYGRNEIISLCQSEQATVILDIGAGRGADLNNLKKIFPHSRTIGVECYPDSCQHLKHNGHEIVSINIESEKLPFADNSIDLIVANQILEHCKEIFWIFHEMSRVLKPGGSLIIGVPNLASLHNRLLLNLGKQPTSIQLYSAHVRGFTYPGFVSFLERIFYEGYAIEGLKGANFYPFPAFLAKILAVIFPKLSVGLFYKLKKKKAYHREFLEYPSRERLETNFYLG